MASQKHVANMSTYGTIQGTLTVTGDIKIGGQIIQFPTTIGAAGSYLRASGDTKTTWTIPTLSGLDDVSISSVLDLQVLRYSSSLGDWINYTLTKADIGLGNVDNLSRTQLFTSPTATGLATFEDILVTGIATYAEVKDLKVNDNYIIVNNGETGSGVTLGDAGLRIDRGLATDYLFQFQESSQTFRVGTIGGTVALAGREDTPTVGGIPAWNGTTFIFDTSLGLTEPETTQLRNIDSTVISALQWSYVGAMNQSVATSASPTFVSSTLTATTNQLVLGTTNTITITSPAPSASRVYTIPDVGGAASFVMTAGAQTLAGVKTFSSAPIFDSLSASSALYLDASKNIASVALTDGQILIGSTSANPVAASITGTANRVTVTGGAGTITLSGPQDLATTSTPTFASVTSSQLILGTGTTITLSGAVPVADRLYTIPDVGGAASFIMTVGTQTITGEKIFTQPVRVLSTTTRALSLSTSASGGNTVYNITMTSAGASTTMTYNLPFFSGIVADFVVTDGDQTLGGIKTFSSAPKLSLTASSALYLDAGGSISAASLTNGQILIGSTGSIPVAASITGTANRVTVTGGAGTITLSGPQDLATTSIPMFGGITGNGLLIYTTGTISQSGTTITGIGTTFTSDMIGGLLIPEGGPANIINGFTDATSLTVTTSGAITTCLYTIVYNINASTTGFTLSPHGHLYIRSQAEAGTDMTAMTFHALGGAGSSINWDVLTYFSPFTTPANGRLQFTDSTFGCDFGYWSKIQGADTNALQRLLYVQSNKTVSTFNNILDTTTTGAVSFGVITSRATSNQIVLGVTNTITLTAPSPSSSRVYTIPDVGGAANFVMTGGTQNIVGSKTYTATITSSATIPLTFQPGGTGTTTSINTVQPASSRIYSMTDVGTDCNFVMTAGAQALAGVKTFSSTPVFSSLTASTALYLDATKNLTSLALSNGQLMIGSTGSNPVAASITGTANRVTVTGGAGTITLSGPQDLATTSLPIFASETLTATTNQLTLGTGSQIIINAPTPATTRTYTIPDAGISTASFVLTRGAQTIREIQTFMDGIVLGTGTTLSNYTELYTTISFAGLFVVASVSVRLVRIGKNVTITVPAFTGTVGVTATDPLLSSALPDEYTPGSSPGTHAQSIVYSRNGGAGLFGFMTFTGTSPQFRIGNIYPPGFDTVITGDTVGIFGFSYSYNIA